MTLCNVPSQYCIETLPTAPPLPPYRLYQCLLVVAIARKYTVHITSSLNRRSIGYPSSIPLYYHSPTTLFHAMSRYGACSISDVLTSNMETVKRSNDSTQLFEYLRTLLNTNNQTYTFHLETPEDLEDNDSDISILSISNGRDVCFHIAVTDGNTDIEEAKDVCSQAVLYRSLKDDPDLHFAVYDRGSQTIHLCLLHPGEEEYEDVSNCSMHGQAEGVAGVLVICIALCGLALALKAHDFSY